MIDPSVAAALARVADRAHDVLHAYEAGFEPALDDVKSSPRRVPELSETSVAAPNDAYFVVLRLGKPTFTRNGSFHFEGGALRTDDGLQVLGHAGAGPGGQLVPLRVDAVDAALGRVANPRIDANGTVSFEQSTLDPRTGRRSLHRCTLGRLALAALPPGTRVVQAADLYVGAPDGVPVHVGVPGDGRFSELTRNVRELGSVSLEDGLQRLAEAYISLEALQSAFRTRGDLDKGAMDLLK
jgi:flagellar basal body rod protein FlgG